MKKVKPMNKKHRKALVCLFKVLYEMGVFVAVYLVAKFFAESVG